MSDIRFTPGVQYKDGKPVPVLSLIEERVSAYMCLGHVFTGDQVLELIAAAQTSVDAANKLSQVKLPD